MGFTEKGGVAVIFAALALVLYAVMLVPQVTWAENGNGNTTVSLWRVCFNNICDFREFNEEIITSEDKASQLLNATLACVVISTIIVISSLFTICCRNRCASGTVLAFASVFMVAAQGMLRSTWLLQSVVVVRLKSETGGAREFV
eukprot:gene9131-1430_t